MTIDEIRVRKHQLEVKIKDLLNEFQRETGTAVKGASITAWNGMVGGDDDTMKSRELLAVSLKIEVD